LKNLNDSRHLTEAFKTSHKNKKKFNGQGAMWGFRGGVSNIKFTPLTNTPLRSGGPRKYNLHCIPQQQHH